MDGLEVVVGTYEEFLLGYKVENTGPEMQLTQSFATHAHTGSVRSVASMGRYLASGGSDDKIVIHDMRTRTESRVLMHHSGTVNSIAFAEEGAHVLSASSDGAFTITRTGNWQIEKDWSKAHKGSSITHIAVHPSNKLALTLGADHTLRTWNLIKGRQAYAINLSSKGAANALTVEWGPEGKQFALTGYNDITVWAVDNAGVKKVLKCPSKSLCLVWISENLVVAGLESGEVMMFDLESEKTNIQKVHEQRVRGLAYQDGFLYTASSSGHIKVFKVKIKKMNLSEKCCVSTGCRITCIALVKLSDDMIKKEEPEETLDQDEAVLSKEARKRKHSEDVDDKQETASAVKKSYMPYVSISLEDDTVEGKEESMPKKMKTTSKNKNKKNKMKPKKRNKPKKTVK